MEVQRSMLEKGYVHVPELAKLEIYRAREAMDGGGYQAARQELEFAERLDPLCPWVPFQFLEMELREKPPFRAANKLGKAFPKVWSEYGTDVPWMTASSLASKAVSSKLATDSGESATPSEICETGALTVASVASVVRLAPTSSNTARSGVGSSVHVSVS